MHTHKKKTTTRYMTFCITIPLFIIMKILMPIIHYDANIIHGRNRSIYTTTEKTYFKWRVAVKDNDDVRPWWQEGRNGYRLCFLLRLLLLLFTRLFSCISQYLFCPYIYRIDNRCLGHNFLYIKREEKICIAVLGVSYNEW